MTPVEVDPADIDETPGKGELPAAHAARLADEKAAAAYGDVLRELQDIAAQMSRTERARKDIAGWRRSILVKATGGQFALEIDDGTVRVEEKEVPAPDFVMVCEDLNTLVDGLAYRGALTDSVIAGKLWLSRNMEFTTIFKLDRMARSLARAKKA